MPVARRLTRSNTAATTSAVTGDGLDVLDELFEMVVDTTDETSSIRLP